MLNRQSLRPIQEIGRVEGGAVSISYAFLNWLEAQFRDVDQIAVSVDSQTGQITTIDGRLDALEANAVAVSADIAAIKTPIHFRAALSSTLIDATWTALVPTVEESQGVTFSTPTFDAPTGTYSVSLLASVTGPTSYRLGRRVDGGAWATLASGLANGTHVFNLSFTAGENVEFGIRPDGAGTLDQASVTFHRAFNP